MPKITITISTENALRVTAAFGENYKEHIANIIKGRVLDHEKDQAVKQLPKTPFSITVE